MKRKTFIKQLMALDVPRNTANSMCRDLLAMRDEMRLHGRHVYVSWEANLISWRKSLYETMAER